MMDNINNNCHLETEELVSNFKYKYEELKYVLELKVKELHNTENTYRDILIKLQSKLDELENTNYKLKNLSIYLEKESEELKYQNIDLIRKLNDLSGKYNFEVSVDNTNDKDILIEDLKRKLINFESLIKEKEEEILKYRYEKEKDNTQLKRGNNNDYTPVPVSAFASEYDINLLNSLRGTKEELDQLKEKWMRKYNYFKEKYSLLKHQVTEKSETIRVI
jgi:hypothetical protein